MEIITDGVVHKSLLCLWLGPCLPFEDHVVVPSVDIKRRGVEKSSQLLCLSLIFKIVRTNLFMHAHAGFQMGYVYSSFLCGQDEHREIATFEPTP